MCSQSLPLPFLLQNESPYRPGTHTGLFTLMEVISIVLFFMLKEI